MRNAYIEHLRAQERARKGDIRVADIAETPASWAQALRFGAGDYLLAIVVMAVWISPSLLWHGFIAHFELVIFFEFFVIILFGLSIAIAGSAAVSWKKALGTALAVLPFCGLIVAMVEEVGHPWPILAVVALFANKLVEFRGLSAHRARQLRGKLLFILIGMVFLYMLSMFLGTFVDWPTLGVTRASVGAERYVTGGEWQSRPQSALAVEVIYFTGVGMVHTLLARVRWRMW